MTADGGRSDRAELGETMDDVATEVMAIIAKKLPVEGQKVELTDRLEDLGIDSFGAVEMIFDLEEKFDIQISYNSNDARPEFETVGDVVAAIKKIVNGTS
jgi:acyl carrier protein